MGFFSNLFGKKSDKLTQGQVDEIEERVEESEAKHVKDRVIFSDLSKPTKTKVKKSITKKLKKPIKKKVKRSVKKKRKK